MPAATSRQDTRRSTWQLPRRPGELPVYVQQRFRGKVFFLVGLQFATVLLVMYLMDVGMRCGWLAVLGRLPSLSSVFLLFAISSLFLLALVSHSHPPSYFVLLLLTLSMGCFWGTLALRVDTWFHYQALGIACVTMLLSAAIATATPTAKMDPMTLLYATVLPGWIVGAIVVGITTSAILPIPEASASLIIAVGYSGLVTVTLLIVDGGQLQEPDPDEFMAAIVQMDVAFLLLVVGIPISVYFGLQGLDTRPVEPPGGVEAPRDLEAA